MEKFMLNNYHSHIRNITVAIGALLDAFNLKIGKSNVPISFAPKTRFIAKLNNNSKIQTFLPRIGFNLEDISYNPELQKQKYHAVRGNNKKSLMPVPYTVTYSIGIYTKSMDEGLEILEQFIPSFTPTLNMKLTESEKLGVITDCPITLESISLDDNWEGSLEGSDLRTIIWDLSISVPINLFPSIDISDKVIHTVNLNFGTIGDNFEIINKEFYNFGGYAKMVGEAGIIKTADVSFEASDISIEAVPF
jgi:hypothetical protein